MSDNLLTLKSINAPLRYIPPQSKNSMRLFIRYSSRECWVNWKTNITLNPKLVDFWRFTKKQPSAAVKPANHWGSWIILFLTIGLETGATLGKASFNLSESPRLWEALIATICFKPSCVRCALILINSKTSLKSKKSACFCVISGYFAKKLIKISISWIFSTIQSTDPLLSLILPISK